MYTYYDLLYEYLYPFLSLYGNVYLYYSAFQSHAFISGHINVFNQFKILKRKKTLYSMIMPIVISNSPVRRDTSSIAKSLP